MKIFPNALISIVSAIIIGGLAILFTTEGTPMTIAHTDFWRAIIILIAIGIYGGGFAYLSRTKKKND